MANNESIRLMAEFTNILRNNPNHAYDFIGQNYYKMRSEELSNIIKELLYGIKDCVYPNEYKEIMENVSIELDEQYEELYQKKDVEWDYFNKFDEITNKYMPTIGEGETMASQIVTAVNKLIYKWYNDGDVFDNTGFLSGWVNDLSSYANWIDKHTEKAGKILIGIFNCYNEDDYERLLKKLADTLLEEKYLEEQNKIEKVETIYKCNGRFRFEEIQEYEEEWEDGYEDDVIS